MPVSTAYLGIILIWSTMPLTIQWSTQGVDFALAVLGRMLIWLVVAICIQYFGCIRFPTHRRAMLSYIVAGLGLFASMSLTYWAARFIYSGLISVMADCR